MMKFAKYSKLSTEANKFSEILAYPLIFCIYIYRYSFSPIIGNSCRFEPSCSRYAEDALRKYGAFKGSMVAVKRVLRCHPWHEGGYDPVK